jgi:hypothetical protein
MGKWLHDQWLRAQGVPEHAIFEGLWKNPDLFTAYPHECVICGRPWRPDYPEYIPLYGRTRYAQVLTEHFTEWWSEALGIAATTGLAPDQMQVRDICAEHADRWASVPNCQTGEQAQMTPPLSRRQRAWRDVCYWTGSVLRFVWLLGQWAWLWAAYKLVGHEAVYVRGPWPPLRKAS